MMVELKVIEGVIAMEINQYHRGGYEAFPDFATIVIDLEELGFSAHDFVSP